MNIHSVGQVVFDFLGSLPIDVEVVEEQLSSDAGLLPVREFDERLKWTEGFAAQIRDGRQWHAHAVVEMVRQRVFGILAGYEDQNDHDTLRSDSVFKLVAGRQPDDLDLASQPTLSRLENSVTASDLLRLTCAENDLVVFPVLLHGTAHASLGVIPDLERVIARLRQEWPDVRIHVRTDSGFAVPAYYLACERMRIEYTVSAARPVVVA